MEASTPRRGRHHGQAHRDRFVTLDGVALASGGPDEDRDSGFVHGGWQAPLVDQASGSAMFEHARSMDTLLLGRRPMRSSPLTGQQLQTRVRHLPNGTLQLSYETAGAPTYGNLAGDDYN